MRINVNASTDSPDVIVKQLSPQMYSMPHLEDHVPEMSTFPDQSRKMCKHGISVSTACASLSDVRESADQSRRLFMNSQAAESRLETGFLRLREAQTPDSACQRSPHITRSEQRAGTELITASPSVCIVLTHTSFITVLCTVNVRLHVVMLAH